MVDIFTKQAMNWKMHQMSNTELTYDANDKSINFSIPNKVLWTPIVTFFITFHDQTTDKVFEFNFTAVEIGANKLCYVYYDSLGYEIAVSNPSTNTFKAFLYNGSTPLALDLDILKGSFIVCQTY